MCRSCFDEPYMGQPVVIYKDTNGNNLGSLGRRSPPLFLAQKHGLVRKPLNNKHSAKVLVRTPAPKVYPVGKESLGDSILDILSSDKSLRTKLLQNPTVQASPELQQSVRLLGSRKCNGDERIELPGASGDVAPPTVLRALRAINWPDCTSSRPNVSDAHFCRTHFFNGTCLEHGRGRHS